MRLDQILSQVLIDDEWHAVHEVLQRTPAAMFVDFGWADYSIPLGILDWYEARWFGLSEIVLRAPMLACGLATLVVLPLYVAPRVGRATASVFAVLLAISPLLIIYSRMARPYAITLLLGWIAHGALVRYHASPRGHTRAGLVYGTAATLALWLHPIVGPFVLAPLLWEALQLRHAAGAADRRRRLLRLASVALPTSLAIAVLLLPPMVAHPESLLGKSGVDVPNLGTLVGVWYAWLGTGYTGALVICLALAAYGAGEIWRALPEAHTGSLGIALTLLAVMLTRPAWSANPATLARYLLPFLPLLLLAVAAGAIKAARRIATPGTAARRVLAAGMAALPCAALAFESPLAPMLQYPSTQTLGLVYYMDFRPAKNPFLPYTHAIPLSPFWQSLAAQPAGSIRIAAAPFYFESYNWDAARWERVSRQRVLPGYLTGLCVDQRGGEVPESPLFDFRNAVHLADERSLAQRKIDYVVWQKPYVQTSRGKLEPIGDDTAHCEPALRARFGAPAFEDPDLIAFRVSRQTESPHAQR
ncbi:MAG TPA: hypothetical protein VG425_13675 [Casimicrobiaceae bacterium]|nr:hypothetical protein [Casimicrobiaceae bacterium]